MTHLDLGKRLLARAYWQAPGVRRLTVALLSPSTLAKLDAKWPKPATGFLDDVLPTKAAEWLRELSDKITGKRRE